MNFEILLSKVGDFHRYQHCLLVLIFYTTFMCGINYYAQIFMFGIPPHKCSSLGGGGDGRGRGRGRGDGGGLNSNEAVGTQLVQDNRELILHLDPVCQQSALKAGANWTDAASLTIDQVEIGECTSGWEYDLTHSFHTISSENDWVCQEDFKPTWITQIFWVGNVVGCVFWGIMNDMLGRKPTLLTSHFVYFLGGVCTYFASGFWWIAFFRFLVGMSHHTVSHLPYLIAVEYVGVEHRVIPLLTMMFSYSFASMTIPFLAQFFTHWHQLLFLAALPNLVVLGLFSVIPESPSWLICSGKLAEAKKALKMVARVNGKDFQTVSDELDAVFDPVERAKKKEAVAAMQITTESRKCSLALLENSDVARSGDDDVQVSERTLFKDKAVQFVGGIQGSLARRIKAILHFIQFRRLFLHLILAIVLCVTGFMCYYGYVENTSNLGSDGFSKYVYGALVEIPAMSIPFLANRLGRKYLILTLFFASALTGISYGFIPWAEVSFYVALFGRLCVCGAYYIALQYASELMPTIMRGTGVAICEIMGGIGLFVSPQIVYLGREHPSLPLLVFGCLGLVGTVATLLLPETAGKALPQSLEDGNNLGRKTWGRNELHEETNAEADNKKPLSTSDRSTAC